MNPVHNTFTVFPSLVVGSNVHHTLHIKCVICCNILWKNTVKMPSSWAFLAPFKLKNMICSSVKNAVGTTMLELHLDLSAHNCKCRHAVNMSLQQSAYCPCSLQLHANMALGQVGNEKLPGTDYHI